MPIFQFTSGAGAFGAPTKQVGFRSMYRGILSSPWASQLTSQLPMRPGYNPPPDELDPNVRLK